MVTIGTQTWMAENLNYADSIAMPNLAGSSWCFADSADNCAKYGRLYTWTGAMNIADTYSSAITSGSTLLKFPHQGACPAGWHVPTYGEWRSLGFTVGGDGDSAGVKLSSVNGWNYSRDGTDDYGFSVLEAGYRDSTGVSICHNYDCSKTHFSFFWSTTEIDTTQAKGLFFDPGLHYHYHLYNKRVAASIRCIQNLSSSSVARPGSGKANWAYLNPAVSYGEFTDSRDGQIYKTVVIGDHTWMAENLNYADSIAMPNLFQQSWCYNNNADSCAKYGRLYTWLGTMNLDGSYSTRAELGLGYGPRQGVCPAGWHIPTNNDWTDIEGWMAYELMSTSGWRGRNGMDSFGFSALPAGEADHSGKNFSFIGQKITFWKTYQYCTDSKYQDYANAEALEIVWYGVGETSGTGSHKSEAFSVRCVKDDE